MLFGFDWIAFGIVWMSLDQRKDFYQIDIFANLCNQRNLRFNKDLQLNPWPKPGDLRRLDATTDALWTTTDAHDATTDVLWTTTGDH